MKSSLSHPDWFQKPSDPDNASIAAPGTGALRDLGNTPRRALADKSVDGEVAVVSDAYGRLTMENIFVKARFKGQSRLEHFNKYCSHAVRLSGSGLFGWKEGAIRF